MKLDRAFQLELLQCLADAYPAKVAQDWTQKHPDADANINYLAELGLIDRVAIGFFDAQGHRRLRIKAKGLDFLAQDGGLSAILGVVTIKLHDDSLARIQQWVLASDVPLPQKQQYIDRLRSLPAETTKHLVMKLLDMGLDSGPKALAAIGTLLGIAS